MLFDSFPDAIRVKATDSGSTPIHLACRSKAGAPELSADFLIDRYPFALEMVYSDGL
jgi:hypothetical protein